MFRIPPRALPQGALRARVAGPVRPRRSIGPSSGPPDHSPSSMRWSHRSPARFPPDAPARNRPDAAHGPSRIAATARWRGPRPSSRPRAGLSCGATAAMRSSTVWSSTGSAYIMGAPKGCKARSTASTLPEVPATATWRTRDRSTVAPSLQLPDPWHEAMPSGRASGRRFQSGLRQCRPNGHLPPPQRREHPMFRYRHPGRRRSCREISDQGTGDRSRPPSSATDRPPRPAKARAVHRPASGAAVPQRSQPSRPPLLKDRHEAEHPHLPRSARPVAGRSAQDRDRSHGQGRWPDPA